MIEKKNHRKTAIPSADERRFMREEKKIERERNAAPRRIVATSMLANASAYAVPAEAAITTPANPKPAAIAVPTTSARPKNFPRRSSRRVRGMLSRRPSEPCSRSPAIDAYPTMRDRIGTRRAAVVFMPTDVSRNPWKPAPPPADAAPKYEVTSVSRR